MQLEGLVFYLLIKCATDIASLQYSQSDKSLR
jgi:hypothetical protein